MSDGVGLTLDTSTVGDKVDYHFQASTVVTRRPFSDTTGVAGPNVKGTDLLLEISLSSFVLSFVNSIHL